MPDNHNFKFKLWPPEASASGWPGIVGLIIVLIIVLACLHQLLVILHLIFAHSVKIEFGLAPIYGGFEPKIAKSRPEIWKKRRI